MAWLTSRWPVSLQNVIFSLFAKTAHVSMETCRLPLSRHGEICKRLAFRNDWVFGRFFPRQYFVWKIEQTYRYINNVIHYVLPKFYLYNNSSIFIQNHNHPSIYCNISLVQLIFIAYSLHNIWGAFSAQMLLTSLFATKLCKSLLSKQ